MAIILRSAESKLVEMLNTIRDPAGWQAVQFHLSSLLEQYKNEYQVKIAINLINDLLKNYEGGIFLLQDHGIVLLCNGMEKTLMSKLIFQMRYLYMDDPLAYTDDGHENPAFCTMYDLTRDWNVFFDLCTRRMAVAVRKTTAPEFRATPDIPRAPMLELPRSAEIVSPSLPVIGTGFSASLSAIEYEVKHADLHDVVRAQPVCTVAKNALPRRVFDELYIHIAHLRQMLKAEIDFLSNRWLFKYLTHALDERMLELIRGGNLVRYTTTPVSLNLNAETLLSAAFDAFDATVKPEIKASIIIELPVVDVFADMAAFNVAKREAQRRGYRLCLDGLTIDSFLNIDRNKLGFDLLKVQWNADVESDLKLRRNIELAKAVHDCGSNRVILCRCDNKQAIDFGHALGIALFQGRHIDTLLNPTAKVAN